jgi:hypothetical protein
MIDKEEFEKASFEENQKFIKKILSLATHNAFTKDDLLFLIKWQNEHIDEIKEAWIDYQMVKDVDPTMESYVNMMILGKYEFER